MYIWREYVVWLECGNSPTSSFHHAQADLEVRLKEKEEELQFLKQQAEREKEQAEREKEQAEREKEDAERVKEEAQREKEELQTQLEMVTKRDQEHKKQLESVKREMERQKQSTLTTQDVCMINYFLAIQFVGRVGPIKDSLTYRPSSQGWAPRVLLSCIFLFCMSCLLCFMCT